jgi:hypothetical protein
LLYAFHFTPKITWPTLFKPGWGHFFFPRDKERFPVGSKGQDTPPPPHPALFLKTVSNFRNLQQQLLRNDKLSWFIFKYKFYWHVHTFL